VVGGMQSLPSLILPGPINEGARRYELYQPEIYNGFADESEKFRRRKILSRREYFLFLLLEEEIGLLYFNELAETFPTRNEPLILPLRVWIPITPRLVSEAIDENF